MLSHRDVSALLGLNRTTSMWELWHINKGSIERSYEESSRSFWSQNLRPHVLAGLQRRYNCKLAPFETRIAHGIIKATAAKILEPGNLPVGGASHIVIDMLSTEGYAQTYGKAEESFLPADRIRASIVQEAFGVNEVAFFLFIGNGEKEDFFTLPRSSEAAEAIADIVRTFLKFVHDDVEPEPDYELDHKSLSFMAVDGPKLDTPFRVDDDPDLVRKISRYQELSAENSTLAAAVRQNDKERSILKGIVADKLRGYSHGTIGNGMVQLSRQVRNIKPRVDEFVTLNIKQ